MVSFGDRPDSVGFETTVGPMYLGAMPEPAKWTRLLPMLLVGLLEAGAKRYGT